MEFKKDDFVVLNDYGREAMFGKNSSKTDKKKVILYKVKHITTDDIIVESVCLGINLGYISTDYFRLATNLEVEIYQLKNIFAINKN